VIIVIPLTTWSSNGKLRGTLRLTETESPIGIQLSYQTAIWGPYTSQATRTSNRDGRHGQKGKNFTTCSTPIHPTTSSVTTFILLADSSTQNSPMTVTKKLQEHWVPAYYTTPPTTTERDVSALILQLTFDTRNPGFPTQGLGSRPGPTHWALALNVTISWSMASGLARLGTVEPKIV